LRRNGDELISINSALQNVLREPSIWESGTVTSSTRAHLIKLTQEREITPYRWVHPDDNEWSIGSWLVTTVVIAL
jgi:hypothetical protein